MTLITFGVLLLKVTILYLAGYAGLLITNKSPAATRHLVCLCAIGGSLLLPIAVLAPSPPIAFHLAAINAVSPRNPGLSRSIWASRDLILAVWAIGFTFVMLRLFAGLWLISRVRRNSSAIEAPFAPASMPVFEADVSVPLVSGLLSPSVFMPRASSNWPEWQKRAALRHELAHIERGDLKANLIAQIACAVYWFHPLAWALTFAMRNEQESACDDAVLHAGFEPADYAQALLAAANNATPHFIFGCPMTTQANVKTRIVRLLDYGIARTTSTKSLRKTCAAFAGLVLAIGMLSPARADEVYKVGGDVTAPAVLQKINPSYSPEAKAAGIQGTVVLNMVIEADGTARDITVVSGIDPGLDANAVAAVQQWRFAPALRKGEPVAARATIEVNFRLE